MSDMKLMGAILITLAWGSTHAGDDARVVIDGRVIDQSTQKPITGVEIEVLVRAVAGPDLEVRTTKAITNATGNYTVAIDDEREGEPRRLFWLRVSHPDYVALKSQMLPVGRVALCRSRGEKTGLEAIQLESGVEYTAKVVDPDGSPVANVPCLFGCSEPRNVNLSLQREFRGVTDARGLVRVRMFPSIAAWATVAPEGHSLEFKTWRGNAAQGQNRVMLPPDLGTIELPRGLIFSGQAIGLDNKPIAGLRVELLRADRLLRRFATTDATGQFVFAPVPPGDYVVGGEGQGAQSYLEWTDGRRSETSRVMDRIAVAEPVYLELRELPSVEVSARFVDPQDRPRPGGAVNVSGRLTRVVNREGPQPPRDEELSGGRANNAVAWGVLITPDRSGRLAVRIPKGLQQVVLRVTELMQADDARRLRIRARPGDAPSVEPALLLGTMDADRSGIDLISSRTASILVKVEREDGEPLQDHWPVQAIWQHQNNRRYSSTLAALLQKDGRWRIDGVLADEEIEVFTSPPNEYVVPRSPFITLTEGELRELTLTLMKRPEPAKVGDLAPPILMATIDGQARSIADYQGKFLLLHFSWSGVAPGDIPELKKIDKLFSQEGRVAILSLSYDLSAKGLKEFVDKEGITWPHAWVRDRMNFLNAAYGLDGEFPNTVLIGPDGTIRAKNLRGQLIRLELDKRLD